MGFFAAAVLAVQGVQARGPKWDSPKIAAWDEHLLFFWWLTQTGSLGNRQLGLNNLRFVGVVFGFDLYPGERFKGCKGKVLQLNSGISEASVTWQPQWFPFCAGCVENCLESGTRPQWLTGQPAHTQLACSEGSCLPAGGLPQDYTPAHDICALASPTPRVDTRNSIRANI